ncbi:hypothetical protein SBRCBS47491_003946 [Sporothrix bragantina]|uniref:Uncharacterized protein n=1 Tax=Sporothrix bragantina TaxID=671064 RepID=A0ABP0BJF8_9PEZI
MSTTVTTTTTSNRTGRILSSVLNDYELHHSQKDGNETDASATASTASSSSTPTALHHDTPADWDNTAHRRVPAYRPVNRERDQGEVRVYLNRIEQVFIGTMFTGVFLNATAARVWRATGGRVKDDIFRYRVGGEF